MGSQAGLRRLLCALAVTLLAAGCASTAGEARPTALIVATDAYELHVRSGEVRLLEPGEVLGAPAADRPLTWEEFRRLYEKAQRTGLPERPPTEGVDVNGWVGLACVRDGAACGREVEPGTRGDAVRIRIVFPTP